MCVRARMAGRRDASACCASQLVPSRCAPLCTGGGGGAGAADDQPMMIDDLRCLQHLPAAARCFHHVHGSSSARSSGSLKPG